MPTIQKKNPEVVETEMTIQATEEGKKHMTPGKQYVVGIQTGKDLIKTGQAKEVKTK